MKKLKAMKCTATILSPDSNSVVLRVSGGTKSKFLENFGFYTVQEKPKIYGTRIQDSKFAARIWDVTKGDKSLPIEITWGFDTGSSPSRIVKEAISITIIQD